MISELCETVGTRRSEEVHEDHIVCNALVVFTHERIKFENFILVYVMCGRTLVLEV